VLENGNNRNHIPTFLFHFYTHRKSILHRLDTICNMTDHRPSGLIIVQLSLIPQISERRSIRLQPHKNHHSITHKLICELLVGSVRVYRDTSKIVIFGDFGLNISSRVQPWITNFYLTIDSNL